ncbi:hypothetical protein FRB95_002091 [Tulasnella sp. JGI-2019a]|nr:hypothetical protein FRB93_000522 [Tulasnella sp. JGI-2019a]KAG9021448.1 hypothetical protein FRB95_002091 [Tulasnella sp. JGI-2019a]
MVDLQSTNPDPRKLNATSSSDTSNPMTQNFVDHATSSEVGAGARANFAGGKDAKATLRAASGVIEPRPGIVESSKTEPLDPQHGTE